MPSGLKAQTLNLEWIKSFDGSAIEYAYDVIADPNGNVYSVGVFPDSIDLDTGTGVNIQTSAGAGDIFIAKFDANGNLLWAKHIGGASGDNAFNVELDENNNPVIAGVFQLTVDFDPGPGVYNLVAARVNDGYLLKLDTLGNFVWVIQFGGPGEDLCQARATDEQGNIYAGGYCQSVVLHATDEGATVTVFGDGPERARLEDAVRAAGLAEAFDLRGTRPRDEIAAALRGAAAFALPSR